MCLTTVDSREGVIATDVVAGVIPVATVISVHVIYHVTERQRMENMIINISHRKSPVWCFNINRCSHGVVMKKSRGERCPREYIHGELV